MGGASVFFFCENPSTKKTFQKALWTSGDFKPTEKQTAIKNEFLNQSTHSF